jgi:hypothetical protein
MENMLIKRLCAISPYTISYGSAYTTLRLMDVLRRFKTKLVGVSCGAGGLASTLCSCGTNPSKKHARKCLSGPEGGRIAPMLTHTLP